MAECPPPSIVLPRVAGGLGAVDDLVERLGFAFSNVADDDFTTIDAGVFGIPIGSHFGHAFAVPNRPGPSKGLRAIGVDGLVQRRAFPRDSIRFGIHVERVAKSNPLGNCQPPSAAQAGDGPGINLALRPIVQIFDDKDFDNLLVWLSPILGNQREHRFEFFQQFLRFFIGNIGMQQEVFRTKVARPGCRIRLALRHGGRKHQQ